MPGDAPNDRRKPKLPVWLVILLAALIAAGVAVCLAVVLVCVPMLTLPRQEIDLEALQEAIRAEDARVLAEATRRRGVGEVAILWPVTAEVVEFEIEDPPAVIASKPTTLGEVTLVVTVRFTMTDASMVKRFDRASLSDAKAVDDHGNDLPQVTTAGAQVYGVVDSADLSAGRSITTKLLFRKPLPTAERIDLDVPGASVGLGDRGAFKFTLPLKPLVKR